MLTAVTTYDARMPQGHTTYVPKSIAPDDNSDAGPPRPQRVSGLEPPSSSATTAADPFKQPIAPPQRPAGSAKSVAEKAIKPPTGASADEPQGPAKGTHRLSKGTGTLLSIFHKLRELPEPTPEACEDQHVELMAKLRQREPAELRRLTKEATKELHSKHPVGGDESYRAVAAHVREYSEISGQHVIKVSDHGAGDGTVGRLLVAACEGVQLVITSSDAIADEALGIVPISDNAKPMIDGIEMASGVIGGVEMASGSQDVTTGRNMYYAPGTAFVTLRAQCDVLKNEGLFCIAVLRQQVRSRETKRRAREVARDHWAHTYPVGSDPRAARAATRLLPRPPRRPRCSSYRSISSPGMSCRRRTLSPPL